MSAQPDPPHPTEVGLFEAKTNLSRLVRGVVAGRGPVTLTERGHPVAKIIPLEPADEARERRRVAYDRLREFGEAHRSSLPFDAVEVIREARREREERMDTWS